MQFLKLPDRPAIKGVKIAYEQFSAQTAAAKLKFIFMPGGPGGDHSIYRPHMDFYTQFGTVVLFDPRGCGSSEANGEQDYDIHTYIDDVEALRQHFQFNDNFVIFGASYGSMSAQGYAVQYGQHLSGLILLNGAPSYEFFASAWKKLRSKGTAEQIAMFQKLCDGEITTDEGMKEYFKVMADMYFESARTAPERFKAYLETRKGSRYQSAATLAGFRQDGFLRTFDWRPNLHKINCPTLIIGGADDWINTPDQWEIMRVAIPNAESHVVADASHFVFVDQSEAYFAILQQFLQRLVLE